MSYKKFKIYLVLTFALFVSGCATLGNTAIYSGKDGRKIEYALLENNNSTDTVVFENGLGGSIDTWVKVIPEISKNATVFAYNRPGYGKSDRPHSPRDGENIVAELRNLLSEKGLKPPYVLVGHSLGGLYMQHFTRRYPQDVKALVLVDSTHPKQMEGVGAVENLSWFVKFAITVLINETQNEELRLIPKSGKEVLSLNPPQGKQVFVLSASKPLSVKSELADYANGLRKDIANLYPNSKQIWVDSEHFMQNEKPDVVINAIKEALKKDTKI